jgi:Arc/MetJ-type ribon-helix-helix transcriptional regulator
MLKGMHRQQIAVRLSEDLLSQIDELVEGGRFDSRAEAVRTALAWFLHEHRRRKTGERIAEGYQRVPQSEEEEGLAMASLREAILEEPW